MRRKFYFGKEKSILGRSSIVETRVLLREGNSIRENKFSYDKEVSMEKELLYEAKFSLWKKECYYEKEVRSWKRSSIIRRSSIVETRVLLREGSSIRENKFSYDKSLWKKNFFMKQSSLYERKSATMRRKFYFGKPKKKTIFQNSFLRHPKFQDLEKTKKTKRTKKNIISELFLRHPKFQDLEKNKKKQKKKTLFQNSFLRHPKFQDLWKIGFFGFLQDLWKIVFLGFFGFLQDLWKIVFVGFWRKYCRCSSTRICRDHFLWEFHWKITFYLGFGTLISIKHCKTQWFWCVLSGKSHPHEHPFCFFKASKFFGFSQTPRTLDFSLFFCFLKAFKDLNHRSPGFSPSKRRGKNRGPVSDWWCQVWCLVLRSEETPNAWPAGDHGSFLIFRSGFLLVNDIFWALHTKKNLHNTVNSCFSSGLMVAVQGMFLPLKWLQGASLQVFRDLGTRLAPDHLDRAGRFLQSLSLSGTKKNLTNHYNFAKNKANLFVKHRKPKKKHRTSPGELRTPVSPFLRPCWDFYFDPGRAVFYTLMALWKIPISKIKMNIKEIYEY